MILTNLVVGIILDQLESSARSSEVSVLDPCGFARVWAKFDTEAQQRIPAAALEQFLCKIGAPLGLSAVTRHWSSVKVNRMLKLKIPIHADRSVSYMDVFEQLALIACGFDDISDVTSLNPRMQRLHADVRLQKDLSRPSRLFNILHPASAAQSCYKLHQSTGMPWLYCEWYTVHLISNLVLDHWKARSQAQPVYVTHVHHHHHQCCRPQCDCRNNPLLAFDDQAIDDRAADNNTLLAAELRAELATVHEIAATPHRTRTATHMGGISSADTDSAAATAAVPKTGAVNGNRVKVHLADARSGPEHAVLHGTFVSTLTASGMSVQRAAAERSDGTVTRDDDPAQWRPFAVVAAAGGGDGQAHELPGTTLSAEGTWI